MKKIVFVTGTRADFGKLKSLIEGCKQNDMFEVHIFVTGMHLSSKYGKTVDEIYKCGYNNIYSYINHNGYDSMDIILSNTINGFSLYIKEINPDLIVIHGDRVEALAGAIVGALNNVLVAHIEGGEVSGTIDELIRHSVSKLSHTHFVSNEVAQARLVQMGEIPENIFLIGSPDIDIMLSNKLPTLQEVKEHYEIPFDDYAVVMFHPVTTDLKNIKTYAENLTSVLLESKLNYVVIYPNNDMGTNDILDAYKSLANNERIKIFPSIRFEYFLVLLKKARFIIGNSSAGIREAPYYGLPTVNIGNRQMNRALHEEIINTGYGQEEIKDGIAKALTSKLDKIELFGDGNSDSLFVEAITNESFWEISKQKQFKDIKYV